MNPELKGALLRNELLYTDEEERNKHLREVESLADEVKQPINEVAGLYEDILFQYKSNARIPDYLPVLVSKKVRAVYRTP